MRTDHLEERSTFERVFDVVLIGAAVLAVASIAWWLDTQDIKVEWTPEGKRIAMERVKNWAIVVPMANEEADFHAFTEVLSGVIRDLGSGKIYLVIDNASRDRTLELSRELSLKDSRYVTIFAPENRNLVSGAPKEAANQNLTENGILSNQWCLACYRPII